MNRLKDLREDKDLLQKDIAKVLNMSQTGYSKYEVGTNDIPTNVLIKLSYFYNVSVDYILGLTNTKERYKWIIKQPHKQIFQKKTIMY